jgi:hypothetical protein
VTNFQVRKSFFHNSEVQQAGGQTLKYWIPADDLPSTNARIVG